MVSIDELKRIPMFADLSAEKLTWLSEHFEVASVKKGEVYSEAGIKAEWLIALIEGRLQFRDDDGQGGRTVFNVVQGQVGGMLPHSRMTHFRAASYAVEDSRVARLHVDHFPEMLRVVPELDSRLMHLMLDRTRSVASRQLQQEKLAGLGTMAAGLAHELNNPASAAKRAAQNLQERLSLFDKHASFMLSAVMFKDYNGNGDPFEPVTERLQAGAPKIDPLTQGELEDDLTDWLEEYGIEQPWDVAATFLGSGLDRPFLEEFVTKLVPEHVINFLNWLPHDLEMRNLSNELTISTERISDLVSAMKSYSYMDQANEKMKTDLHKGIDDTLIVMAHKFTKKAIKIDKKYGDIPPFQAYGGELNQVWTNLLDNAADAVPDTGGVIEIITAFDAAEDCIMVQVIDNGHGIPEEKKARIFEPFFTTKEAGRGTGLGLDITYRIVTSRHGGALDVESKPGETRFSVRLPYGG